MPQKEKNVNSNRFSDSLNHKGHKVLFIKIGTRFTKRWYLCVFFV